jgi:hypothetical protein
MAVKAHKFSKDDKRCSGNNGGDIVSLGLLALGGMPGQGGRNLVDVIRTISSNSDDAKITKEIL